MEFNNKNKFFKYNSFIIKIIFIAINKVIITIIPIIYNLYGFKFSNLTKFIFMKFKFELFFIFCVIFFIVQTYLLCRDIKIGATIANNKIILHINNHIAP